MEIGRKFNILTLKEYLFFIAYHKKYTDFNVLGLYRSIVENQRLSLDEKQQVRDYAHQFFRKTFEFLQLKDPRTYVDVKFMGQELTKGDEEKIWNEIRKNQQRILEDKKIKHRNFGQYAKHNCGYESCVYNGIMIRQGSWLAEDHMYFDKDKHKYHQQVKSERRKLERKKEQLLIARELENQN